MVKRKRKLRKRIPSLTLVILILLSAIFSYTGDLKASDELSGYSFHVVENADHTAADIIGDSTHINEGVEIIEIADPDGAPMDLENISYHVAQNDVYTFQVFFRSPAGEHKETIPISVNTILVSEANMDQSGENPASDINTDQTGESPVSDKSTDQADEKPVSDTKTVGELREARKLEQKTVPFLIPMYIEGEKVSQGNYSFPGGDIVNIEDQVFNGLPYKLHQAQILIMEGDGVKTYPINYYDEINGVQYYALSNSGSASQDFEIAYEVPEGASVSFIFSLNTQSYPVTVNNPKAEEGFQIQYITGIKTNPEGSLISQHNSQVKLLLTYPTGYYTKNAPAGKKNVGIEFSDPSLIVTKEIDQKKRTISYTFTHPDMALTLNVVGDKETTGLMYGVYDGTSVFQRLEQGYNWWRATDPSGEYTKGQPYYGYGAAKAEENTGVLKVRGGTAANVKMEGAENPVSISSGTFDSGQELHFEYAIQRVNANGKPPYFFWPSPTMSFCYFPNGADYETDMPVTETFPLWDSGWIYDPSNGGTQVISHTYEATNGARITVTVKKSVYTEMAAAGGVKLNYPTYQAHVKIENMQNSFYIKTQGSGSVQGPHYFRNLDNISLELNNNTPDSYFLEDYKDEQGGNTGTIGERGIRGGGIFLDKRAVYNKNILVGGVPWADPEKPFFKFGITPEWGYTNPRVESYGEGSDAIMTNKPIEIEKKELESQNGQIYQELTLGNYSWFHAADDRKNISPFQYVLFMPVESLTTKHDMRAIDVKTDMITGTVTNNNAYVDTAAPQNQIVEGDGTFDLLVKDKVVLNQNFKAPEQTGQVFAGFTVTITAPDNLLLPSDYKLELAKSIDNTVYFKPGDIISISDFFRRDTAALQNTWNTAHTFTAEEQDRLNLIMYSSKLSAKVNLIYEDAASSEGQVLSGRVNKYLQDVSENGLKYSTTIADTKSINVIKGTNIKFNKFAETFVNPADHYTYYLNEENTTSLDKVAVDNQEIASVKYDRGLTVSYLNEDGSPLTGISDKNVYKTYAGSSRADIMFPGPEQSPPGKALDYWTLAELDDTGNWIPNPDVTIKEGDPSAVYEFSSGPAGNNKSIQLQAVWKDISPDSYISIPKNIQLSENGTNLTPEKDYAGTKVTVAYHSVNGSDKQVNVDVLKNFDLTQTTDQNKKLTVSSYDSSGNPLTTPGINGSYARAGMLGPSNAIQDIWFNTKSQDGNGVFKGVFQISTNQADIAQDTLFYISAVQ